MYSAKKCSPLMCKSQAPAREYHPTARPSVTGHTSAIMAEAGTAATENSAATEHTADIACGCDCGLWDDSDESPACEWTRCECKVCGIPGQGCKIRCSEVRRWFLAHQRCKDVEFQRACENVGCSSDTKKEHPKFCEDCVSHGLLDLRRQSVQRSRKRRADAQEDGLAKKAFKADSTGRCD